VSGGAVLGTRLNIILSAGRAHILLRRHTEEQRICTGAAVSVQRSEDSGTPDAQMATVKGTRWCVLYPGHVSDLDTVEASPSCRMMLDHAVPKG
jgi:hypothetical protein